MERSTNLTFRLGAAGGLGVPGAPQFGIAVLSIAAALMLATFFKGAPVSFFLCAIMVSVSFGGLWPGLLAIALSQLAFAFYLAGFAPSQPGEMPQLGRQAMFAAAGLFIVGIALAERRWKQSAARARDELRSSQRQLGELSRRTFRAQDDERRRIARVIHETTAQELAALRMHLARLEGTAATLANRERAVLREITELTDQSLQGIRTDTFLLYAPELDEMDLVAAMGWFANGFAERARIHVTHDLPPAFPRLRQDIETALFRVLQEALMNIHRHAGSPTVEIALRQDGGVVVLQVVDRGRGMPADLLRSATTLSGALGVGIAGMRDRLRELGGRLEIESSRSGTTLRAIVPVDGTPVE